MTDTLPRTPARRRRSLAATAALLLAGLSGPALAQVNDPAYADYFLVGQFGEICTMCEATVLCEATDAPPALTAVPEQGSFTLYYLHTRTFWSQVTTIWEWFVSNFSSAPLVSGHSRPMTIYTVTDGQWAPPVAGEVHVSLEPGLLAISDGREIDRKNRRWQLSAPGPGAARELGYCQRMPLWDTLAVIEAHDPTKGQAGGDRP